MSGIGKALTILVVLTAGTLAQAKLITAPVNLRFDGLFTAGTATYLSEANEELNSQIAQICGPGAILLKLDVRYQVVQGQAGADVSAAKMAGEVTCRTRN